MEAQDRLLLRVGALSGIVGTIVGATLNIIHPRPSVIGDPEVTLTMVATSDIWLVDHISLIPAAVLTLGAFIALTRTIEGAAGRSWALLGAVSALLSTTVTVLFLIVDGIAMHAMAVEWATAPAAEKAATFFAAVGVEQVAFALFSASILLHFGVTHVLYGLAVAYGEGFPRWLGWVAIVFGAGCVVVGFVQSAIGVTPVTVYGFVALSVPLTLWVLWMSVLLWRRTVPVAVPSVAVAR